MIPKIGFIASALATLIAYGVMMLISYLIGKKYYPIPYELKKVSGYIILTSLLSGISFLFFRENYIISVGFIFLFLGWIYYNEKTMIKQLLIR